MRKSLLISDFTYSSSLDDIKILSINNRNPIIHKSALSWIEVLDISTLTGLSSVSVQRRLHSGSGCRLSPAPAASTVYATPSYPSSWTGPRNRERLCAVRRVGERTDGSAASENATRSQSMEMTSDGLGDRDMLLPSAQEPGARRAPRMVACSRAAVERLWCSWRCTGGNALRRCPPAMAGLIPTLCRLSLLNFRQSTFLTSLSNFKLTQQMNHSL